MPPLWQWRFVTSGKNKCIHIYCYSWSKVHSSNIFYYLKIANLIHLLYWKSNIHSVVLISCHKHTSRISQLIVMFVMMAALLSQGKIFYKHIYSKISLKKSLFKHIGKFHKQCRSHTLCIPKYEQYQVRTYCQNVSMVEVPTIFARVLKPTLVPCENTPLPAGGGKKKLIFPVPWQERLCRSLRGTRKERQSRSLPGTLPGTLFKEVKVGLTCPTLTLGRTCWGWRKNSRQFFP